MYHFLSGNVPVLTIGHMSIIARLPTMTKVEIQQCNCYFFISV